MILRLLVSASILLGSLGVLVACGETTRPDPSGTLYHLRTLNGEPVPAVVFESDTERLEVTVGTVRLHEDGTFRYEMSFLLTQGAATATHTNIATGTFTRSGTAISLKTEEQTLEGTLVGDTLTIVDEDFVLVFTE